jgi:hypothetical protein
MNSNLIKYLKYKSKYLETKKQIGGKLNNSQLNIKNKRARK